MQRLYLPISLIRPSSLEGWGENSKWILYTAYTLHIIVFSGEKIHERIAEYQNDIRRDLNYFGLE